MGVVHREGRKPRLGQMAGHSGAGVREHDLNRLATADGRCCDNFFIGRGLDDLFDPGQCRSPATHYEHSPLLRQMAEVSKLSAAEAERTDDRGGPPKSRRFPMMQDVDNRPPHNRKPTMNAAAAAEWLAEACIDSGQRLRVGRPRRRIRVKAKSRSRRRKRGRACTRAVSKTRPRAGPRTGVDSESARYSERASRSWRDRHSYFEARKRLIVAE